MTSVAFLVNGDHGSAAGYRARAFADRLGGRFDVSVAYRGESKLASIRAFRAELSRLQPDVTYVVDMAYSGVAAAAAHRATSRRNRVIVDTGDAITALARSLGERGPAAMAATAALERFSLALADTVVVRGSYHKTVLDGRTARVEVVQDGVDVDEFAGDESPELRRELGLDGALTVGLLGSSVWSEKLGICYGWELVELVRILEDRPVRGVMIGGGSGIAKLKERCERYGISDRITFLDFIPYPELPRHVRLMDVCLSTQTDDVVGRVRTTGKLPIYLAAGRYVLASRVGEAALVLGDEMLVDYDGVVDDGYPERLAARVSGLLDEPSKLRRADAHEGLARERFDYSVLADRLAGIVARAAERS